MTYYDKLYIRAPATGTTAERASRRDQKLGRSNHGSLGQSQFSACGTFVAWVRPIFDIFTGTGRGTFLPATVRYR